MKANEQIKAEINKRYADLELPEATIYMDGNKAVYARFNTTTSDGRRAEHFIVREGEHLYVHIISMLVDKDVEPIENGTIYISERVFWGKVRLAQLYETHYAATFITVGQLTEKMERML